ncbi:hypothetical protein [Microseira wollei]|uniref:Uncharacterized protein n=1 Tax=Microseira wollei NIES-4236 TaxID=2530354 RepID=A0AAV3XA46_9CYAN|nr:hypothetical protein [Microseira wollei]GET38206.1 hypothetical protein MiSe_29600 [Microseira wollei NIES-4236]
MNIKINKEAELRIQQFSDLKRRYRAEKHECSSPSSLLYLILRKAVIGVEITDLEFNWLLEHELFETIEIIEHDQQYRSKEISNLENELSQLKYKYKVTEIKNELDISSPLYQHINRITSKYKNVALTLKDKLNYSSILYPILTKLDSENNLNDTELEWLKQNGFANIAALAQDMGRFALLKTKYKATEYQDSSPDSRLYQILKQLEAEERLSNSDIKWLKQNQLLSTLDIFQQQEKVREARFAQLKEKYQATKYLEPSVSSPLYLILQRLDANCQLTNSQIEWLKQHELTETITIADELEQKRVFASLKIKYKATQSEDLSLSSHLYKVLKRLETDICLPESDLNFLRKRKLTETINIALDKYAANMKFKIESGEQLSEADINASC